MMKGAAIQGDQGIAARLGQLNWGLVLLVFIIAGIGFTALYSAAGGSLSPYAQRQMVRFAMGLCGMFFIALVDIRWWHRLSYVAYAAALFLLVAVELIGHVGMGAQRWIDLGFMVLQPSEVMKITLLMALARYFHGLSPGDAARLQFLIPPALMIALPLGLVLIQPDLGTSIMMTAAAIAVVFLAGAPLWLFIGGAVLAFMSAPIGWHFLHDYQKQRILTFMNPESDPLGSGYHIIQSKIALGSGGIEGKGFLQGTQSHLNFLPEKQTDFIFTLWAEEWGLTGGLLLLALYGLVFIYCGWIAFRCRHQFGRLLVFGLMVNFSLYVFVNVGMVMGLIPVVGAPLPLVSYGGTVMLTVLGGFGLMMSCNVFRDSKLPRI